MTDEQIRDLKDSFEEQPQQMEQPQPDQMPTE